MGFFSGLKKRWNDGSLMAGLQSAGAIANGDYGTAAQIQGLYRKGRKEAEEEEQKLQTAQAAVAALVRQGIPEADAMVLVKTGAADTVLAGRYGKESEPAIARNAAWWQNATPEQRAAAEAYSAATAGPASVSLPNGGFYYGRPADLPRVLGQGGQGGGMPRVQSEDDYNRLAPGTQYTDPQGNVRTKGGAASNGSSNFRNAFADFQF